MVGGTVIEVVDLATKVYINCVDKPRGRKKADECAIYVERNSDSEQIDIGDIIWWQGQFAYWTPLNNLVCGRGYDIKIPRIGYSGVSRPNSDTQSD